MYTRAVTELQDLIEKPVEREWLELKSWIDLKDKSAPSRARASQGILPRSPITEAAISFSASITTARDVQQTPMYVSTTTKT
jgi:hypothetical protein